jgi:uncharacterized RmlC-like cupin family protein
LNAVTLAGKLRGLLDRAGQSLEWRPFPLLSDFVFIPTHTVHQEINASADRPTVWVVTRSHPDPLPVWSALRPIAKPQFRSAGTKDGW